MKTSQASGDKTRRERGQQCRVAPILLSTKVRGSVKLLGSPPKMHHARSAPEQGLYPHLPMKLPRKPPVPEAGPAQVCPAPLRSGGVERESQVRGFGLCTCPAPQRAAGDRKFCGCTAMLSLTCSCEHLCLEGAMAERELSALGKLLCAETVSSKRLPTPLASEAV